MSYVVTIGLPVYNVEKYISQTLESALAQTFPSIEFLICDDCGTDSSISIIKEYQLTHSRGKDIRIIKQNKNMGVGCARNLIIKEAQGEYLFFLDSDDLIVENAIEILYENAKKYNSDIVYGSMEKVLVYDGNKRFKNIEYPFSVFDKIDNFAQYAYREYDSIQASSCNYLVKLDIYRKNDLKYYPINYWEDLLMSIDLPLYVTRAVLIPDITYQYICRTETLSHYQKRTHIEKKEILEIISAISKTKHSCSRLREKIYFSQWLYKVMMSCFYVTCSIIRNKSAIFPPFSKQELCDIMYTPISLSDLLLIRKKKLANFMLFLIGVLPCSMSMMLLTLLGKYKKLV